MEIFRLDDAGMLLVSGVIDDWAEVERRGVDAIVDMDGDVDPGLPEVPNRILYVYFPILDEELPDLRKLDALARMVASLVERGHGVLVHCRMGFNRSNLVAATALTYLGVDGESALERIRGIRPGALFNQAFAQHVRGLPARRLRVEALEG